MSKGLEYGKEVPGDYHVARYCFGGTVKVVFDEGFRKVVVPRAFEKGSNRTADVSVSVMEWFDKESDPEVIFEVCKYRGCLVVREGGDYVKLNVNKIRSKRYGGDRRKLRLIFKPDRNPAHAVLYSEGLMVSMELASLANYEGIFIPVPIPVPDVVFPD